MSIGSGPVPLYNNPPIQPEFYTPNVFVISAISTGSTTTVTTTEDMNYVVGQLVRFIIPPAYGIRQLNEKKGYVISLPASNQVEIDVPSIGYDAFVSSSGSTQAQILGIGDINTGPINSSGRTNNQTYISGSFINIS